MSFVKLKCRVCGNSFNGKTRNMLLRELEPGRCHKCVKKAAQRQGMIFFKRSVKKVLAERKLMNLVKTILATIVLLISTNALGDELTTHFLLGKDNVGYKALGATYSKPIYKMFNAYIGADIMMDNDVFSKPFFSSELGTMAEVKTALGLYIKAGVAAAVVSASREGLASKFQIANTVGLGLYNELGGIGFVFKHYSNGTPSYKNTGRNYIGLELVHEFK